MVECGSSGGRRRGVIRWVGDGSDGEETNLITLSFFFFLPRIRLALQKQFQDLGSVPMDSITRNQSQRNLRRKNGYDGGELSFPEIARLRLRPPPARGPPLQLLPAPTADWRRLRRRPLAGVSADAAGFPAGPRAVALCVFSFFFFLLF